MDLHHTLHESLENPVVDEGSGALSEHDSGVLVPGLLGGQAGGDPTHQVGAGRVDLEVGVVHENTADDLGAAELFGVVDGDGQGLQLGDLSEETHCGWKGLALLNGGNLLIEEPGSLQQQHRILSLIGRSRRYFGLDHWQTRVAREPMSSSRPPEHLHRPHSIGRNHSLDSTRESMSWVQSTKFVLFEDVSENVVGDITDLIVGEECGVGLSDVGDDFLLL